MLGIISYSSVVYINKEKVCTVLLPSISGYHLWNFSDYIRKKGHLVSQQQRWQQLILTLIPVYDIIFLWLFLKIKIRKLQIFVGNWRYWKKVWKAIFGYYVCDISVSVGRPGGGGSYSVERYHQHAAELDRGVQGDIDTLQATGNTLTHQYFGCANNSQHN